jgi:lysozyme family protein
MADFLTCYNWMIANEDATLSYRQTVDACPSGCAGPCLAISGINSGAFPVEFAAIAAIPQADRGPAVQHFYQTQFWNQWYEALTSVDLAKRIFDQAVNGGAGTAVRILQASINTLIAEPIAVDGGWGPNTVGAANGCDADALIRAFISIRCAHYRSIAAANPADAKFLNQWIARAEK